MSSRLPNRHFLFLCLSSAIIIFFYGYIDYQNPQFESADLHRYWSMAEAAPGLSIQISKPFAFRLLGPYLAGLVPIDPPLAFYLLNLMAVYGLIILFYDFLKDRGIRSWLAVYTVLIFICNRYFFGFIIWNYFQIDDTLSLLFLLLSYRAMRQHKWALFGFYLGIGILAREIAVLMIPTAFVYVMEKRKYHQFYSILAAILPAILIFVIIRQFVPATGGMGLYEAFTTYLRHFFSPVLWYRRLVNSFVPLSFLPLIFWPRTYAFFKKSPHLLIFLACLVASTLFGLDKERLMAPSFFVFYWLCAEIFERYFAPFITPLIVIWGAAFLTTINHLAARYPLSDRQLTIYLSLGSLVLVTGISGYIRWNIFTGMDTKSRKLSRN